MTRRPNILLIMSDDHAANAIGSYGSRINTTPNIDRLADQGMRFDGAACTNALCAPSRASILTGTYSHVNRVTTLQTHIDASQPSFPQMLRDGGYRTGLVGKWHLGHGGIHDPQGFDYWEVLNDQGEYHDPVFFTADGERRRSGYATDVITDLALDWAGGLAGDEPWCLMVNHKAPHRPWSPAPRHANLYDDVDIPLPDTFFDDYEGRASAARNARMRVARDLNVTDVKGTPPDGLSDDDRARWYYRRYIVDYLRCVAAIDENVGRVLDWLDETGQAENTVVLYTSDQGFFLGEHGWYDKRFMYTESLQMPLLVRYPPLVPAGTVNRDIVLNVDFAQTFLDLAGVEPHPRMQGRSIVPLLSGDRPADWRRSAYYRYWEHLDGNHNVPAHCGVWTERYKLVHYYGFGAGQPGASEQVSSEEWELFDLREDPAELRSVYADPTYALVIDELTAELHRLQKELDDTLTRPSAAAAPSPGEERPM
jgi:arylsulfatase A-like enzyme